MDFVEHPMATAAIAWLSPALTRASSATRSTALKRRPWSLCLDTGEGTSLQEKTLLVSAWQRPLSGQWSARGSLLGRQQALLRPGLLSKCPSRRSMPRASSTVQSQAIFQATGRMSSWRHSVTTSSPASSTVRESR